MWISEGKPRNNLPNSKWSLEIEHEQHSSFSVLCIVAKKENKEDPYIGLWEKLNKEDFPRVYYFKFIFPNDNRTLALVQALFSGEAQMKINKSRNGKYLSVSAKELMPDAESIIERYKKASDLEGVMAL